MKTALIAAAAILGLIIIWLALGRHLVSLVDTFATEGDTVAAQGPFVYALGSLNIANTPLDTASPDGITRDVTFNTEADRVSLQANGKTFPLGPRTEVSNMPGPYDVAFKPDPGDTVTFRTAHSTIAWPTPFDLNFMTGKSPSWRRNTYYTLSWRKPDGATLTMTWRYEQWFYDDWASPQMISPGRTGLIRADIDGGL